VLEGWFEGRGAWMEQTYEPETERFGGPQSMQAAEEYFHLSTRVILALMNKPYTYNDALFDALRLHTVTAFAAGWSREKAAWYFEKLAKLWLPLFFRDADTGAAPDAAEQAEILSQLEGNVMSQQTALKSSLQDLWTVLESDKFDKTQPDWVRWTRGNQMIIKELGTDLEKAMPSLLHLNYNRLGIYNQDEVYLNLLLARLL
jgi:thiopeptide-type bacteriocin biosynthesis protein